MNKKIFKNGNIRHYNDRENLHRDDGPAVITSKFKKWYRNGHLYRENGPSIEYSNGNKEWCYKFYLHRTDGPATEAIDGYKQWFLLGSRMNNRKMFNSWIFRIRFLCFNTYKAKEFNKLKNYKDTPLPKMKIFKNGNKRYYNNKGQIHRDNGPAVINTNGFKGWYKNGLRHRDNAPAKTFKDGSEEWLVNGEFHRLNKPAVVNRDGHTIWFRYGEEHRTDGPAVISELKTENRKDWYLLNAIIDKEYFNNWVLRIRDSYTYCSSKTIKTFYSSMSRWRL